MVLTGDLSGFAVQGCADKYITCHYYSNLEYVRRISPEQSVQYLFSQVSDELTERLNRDRIDVAILYGALTEEALAVFHGAGLTVNCWTVDDKATAEALAAMGVDYITTNILE